MYILGLNAYHGDAAACLFKDGQLVAATEEERLRGVKHWAGFPSEAVKFCLAEAGVSIKEVDYIAISRDPSANLHKKVLHAAKRLTTNVRSLVSRFANSRKVSGVKQALAEACGVPESAIAGQIVNVEHHRSHMASAFFASDFETAAILSIDGFGDFTSTMRGTGRGTDIDVIDAVLYPHSIGAFYTAMTQFLGFHRYGDEYKVMGLAPYGEPTYYEDLREVVKFKPDGLFELNVKYFRHPKEGVSMSWEDGEPTIEPMYAKALEQKFGPARQADEDLTEHYCNLAASTQKLAEEAIFHILGDLQRRTGLKKLCLAGGVAQNSVANGKILDRTGFEELYVPPAGHDAGTALGAALYVYHQQLGKPRLAPMRTSYMGARFSNEEIEAYLESEGVAYSRLPDPVLFERVVECLAEGGVVGWFQGRAEFGPRALGNRSILADPRRKDARQILNEKIKRREPFRPFAPSIQKERVGQYFERDEETPFMERVFAIKEDMQEVVPAVTHVDGTGRLQTVDRLTAPRYYGLIEAFRQRTGVPILLNTSFNENEPIVNTPQEAYACFRRTSMDLLVMENVLVER